ncbi:hypothetical protein AB0J74_00420 [Asanoa sp. NPDC049573]|uniref:hypothetical protein n=1 Tax=Asanoa sp. NPDC049573 TaxID=3155396 RepID=UPI00343F4302
MGRIWRQREPVPMRLPRTALANANAIWPSCKALAIANAIWPSCKALANANAIWPSCKALANANATWPSCKALANANATWPSCKALANSADDRWGGRGARAGRPAVRRSQALRHDLAADGRQPPRAGSSL